MITEFELACTLNEGREIVNVLLQVMADFGLRSGLQTGRGLAFLELLDCSHVPVSERSSVGTLMAKSK